MTRPFLAIGLAAIVMLASSCVQSPAAPAVSPTDIAATVEAAVAATVAALPQNSAQNSENDAPASTSDSPTTPQTAIIATPIVQATATEVGVGPIITGTELAVTPVTATAVVTNTTVPTATNPPIATSLPPSETVPITATVTVSATLLPTSTGVVTGTVVPDQTAVPTTTVVPTNTAILTATVTPTTTVVPTDTVVPTGTVSPTTVPPTTPEPKTPAPTSQPTATTGPTAVPTTTPTPGPSPTPSPMPATIFIGSHHSYSEGSSLYVVGEAINGSSAPVYDVTIIATFHDGNGNLVGASEATTILPQTVPTQANPFKLQLPNAPANVSDYELTLRWNEINVATFGRATIISEEILTENGLEIVGELRNDHRSPLRNLVVVATFYDASGAVLDVVRGQTNDASLPPDETATFNVQTRQSIPYASYLVQIEGMLLP